VKLPVTAIIVSYNSAEMLPRCIEGLRGHLAPDQVLVVDNASSDSTVTVAQDLGAQVIANRANLGFGAGCNVGARSASHDILMFVNPDVWITSADVDQLNALTIRRPLGLLAPRTFLTADRQCEDSSVRRIMPWPCDVAREALGPVLPRNISDRLLTQLDGPSGHSWLSGAFLICERGEFLGLGGFDERLFLYYEDRELSRRYITHGLPLDVTNAINARHVHRASPDATGTLHRVPRAASAMSSIELVGITHGPQTARRAWWLYRALERSATTLAWLAARGDRSTRSMRKLRELRSTRSAATALLERSGPSYPLVKDFVKSA
jgi:N-acetylglucosaminyl-diphospho-decaprenol L-rhamnosyltransferase